MGQIVVVGASLAGVHAVEALRNEGYDGGLVLIGAESHRPYDRPPLTRLRPGHEPEWRSLRAPSWYSDLDVRLELGRTATRLRPGDRTVRLDDGEDVPYESLVIATGSSTRPLHGGDHGVHTLRSIDDAAWLSSRLSDGGNVVIVGAGFLGLEVAASLRTAGVNVTAVEVAPVPLARVLGDEVGDWFRQYHARHGVKIMCDAFAVAVEPTGRGHGHRVRLQDGRVLDADIVVSAVGAVPAVGWLRTSGLLLADGVVCNARLQASLPNVVAAGDVARWYNPLFDETMRVEQWTNAVEQGRHAARSLLGDPEPYAPVPYLWSDQFDARLRFVGRANATEVQINERTDDSLVAVYSRDGVVVGALCVNAPARLAEQRDAIKNRRTLVQ
ncbi:NAD(P)/FAD-dependent oxidoreductase [Streptomyces sp. NPDC059455]|uniref:NAD(P)/FAD-dependent oxidoreductase n=1 Tax=Streptomyces sp. NPDC059455 TaxID=3346837 RepID=UPI00368D0FA7